MGLAEDVQNSSIAGLTPWHDAVREFSKAAGKHSNNSGVFDRYKNDYEAAGIEVRAALADGKWHKEEEVRVIAKRHGIKQIAHLMDRCGVYHYNGDCIWANA